MANQPQRSGKVPQNARTLQKTQQNVSANFKVLILCSKPDLNKDRGMKTRVKNKKAFYSIPNRHDLKTNEMTVLKQQPARLAFTLLYLNIQHQIDASSFW
ncbi:hypothetical protein PoB_005662600 [Plakobranchus ocellatus]|uniref:Uncharacterized protein n=1 Tax=Plakobranchus ocellatus TaxID=259542 RepID=A0AAV4CFG7_9GAST|nr:hypothetical protein PoB_005662600 [Plakobranchus ocellatus]